MGEIVTSFSLQGTIGEVYHTKNEAMTKECIAYHISLVLSQLQFKKKEKETPKNKTNKRNQNYSRLHVT